MAFVIRYGNIASLNGWRMVDQAECNWVVIPGTNPPVHLQIRQGIPTIIMTEFARRFNERIEPLRDPDSACWTPTNAVATSQHLAAVACDLNWESHKFHAYGTFGDRLPKLRALLNEFRGTVGWGGDWGGNPQDEMHFEIDMREGYVNDDHVFVVDVDPRLIAMAREIEASAPRPPLSRAERYAQAIIAEGRRLGISDRGIKIALSVALVETNLTNYANSNDPASMAIPHDAVGSDHMSSGVFQQQPPWGPLAQRMNVTDSARIFYTVDNGPGVRGLTKIRDGDGDPYDYNNESHSPGFYAQKVQGSAFPDRYDGRWQEANDLFNRLSTTSPPSPIDLGDDMAAVPQDEWNEIRDKTRQLHGAMFNPIPSGSRYADPTVLWPTKDLIHNDDAFLFNLITEHDAALGDQVAMSRVQKAAAEGDHIAQAFLDQLATASTPPPPVFVPPYDPSLPPDYPPQAPPPVNQPPPPPPPPVSQPGSSFATAVEGFAAEMAALKESLNRLIG